jgi:hypothetical protein
VVGVEPHSVEEIVGEDAPLLVSGFLPDLPNVELGEQLGDGLERLDGGLGGRWRRRLFSFHGPQTGSEAGLLFSEEVGADLAGVVQVEQLASPFPQALRLLRRRPPGPLAGSRSGGPAQLLADRPLQVPVEPNQTESEHGRPFDAPHRP